MITGKLGVKLEYTLDGTEGATHTQTHTFTSLLYCTVQYHEHPHVHTPLHAIHLCIITEYNPNTGLNVEPGCNKWQPTLNTTLLG